MLRDVRAHPLAQRVGTSVCDADRNDLHAALVNRCKFCPPDRLLPSLRRRYAWRVSKATLSHARVGASRRSLTALRRTDLTVAPNLPTEIFSATTHLQMRPLAGFSIEVSPEIGTRWRSGMDSNSRIWTQPRSQAARSIKVKPVAFVYTASVRSSVICSGP
jgi:hypothetical protein